MEMCVVLTWYGSSFENSQVTGWQQVTLPSEVIYASQSTAPSVGWDGDITGNPAYRCEFSKWDHANISSSLHTVSEKGDDDLQLWRMRFKRPSSLDGATVSRKFEKILLYEITQIGRYNFRILIR